MARRRQCPRRSPVSGADRDRDLVELLRVLVDDERHTALAGPPQQGAGVVIDIDEALVRERSALDFEFSFPRWRHDDGSVAEW